VKKKISLKRTLFELKQTYLIIPYEGVIDSIKSIKSFFNKTNSVVYMMVIATVIIIFVGFLGNFTGVKISPYLYLAYSVILLLLLLWKNRVSGELDKRWQENLDKKIKKQETKHEEK